MRWSVSVPLDTIALHILPMRDTSGRPTVRLTCRRRKQDFKLIIARNFADLPCRTHAGGGQVQPVLGGSSNWQSRNDTTLYLVLVIQVELSQCAF
jgi:hypothetical protein